jgi:hypothetical protein
MKKIASTFSICFVSFLFFYSYAEKLEVRIG